MRRPFDRISSMASSSARRRGLSQMGRTLPSKRILAFLVLRARIDPMRFMVAFMQEGVLGFFNLWAMATGLEHGQTRARNLLLIQLPTLQGHNGVITAPHDQGGPCDTR